MAQKEFKKTQYIHWFLSNIRQKLFKNSRIYPKLEVKSPKPSNFRQIHLHENQIVQKSRHYQHICSFQGKGGPKGKVALVTCCNGQVLHLAGWNAETGVLGPVRVSKNSPQNITGTRNAVLHQLTEVYLWKSISICASYIKL